MIKPSSGDGILENGPSLESGVPTKRQCGSWPAGSWLTVSVRLEGDKGEGSMMNRRCAGERKEPVGGGTGECPELLACRAGNGRIKRDYEHARVA
jgi:hypothetical protein